MSRLAAYLKEYRVRVVERMNYALNPRALGPAAGRDVPNFSAWAPGTGEVGVSMTSDSPLSTGVVETNYIINPSFETSTAGWAASSCTISRVTNPTRPQRVGAYMGMIQVPDSPTGTVYIGTNTHTDFPALLTAGAGQWVGASVLLSRSTGAQYARVSIQWYNGTTAVSLSHGPIGLLSAGSATRFSVTAQAPATATAARLLIYPLSTSTGGTPQAGNTLVDAAMLVVALTEEEAAFGSSVYFDGAQPAEDSTGDRRYVHAWAGTAHASASTRALTITPGATGPDGIPGFARRVIQTAKTATSTGWAATASMFRAPLPGTAASRIRVSVYVRFVCDPGLVPGTVHRSVRLRGQAYNAAGTQVGFTDTPLVALPPNEWVRLDVLFDAATTAFETFGWWVYQTTGSNLPRGSGLDATGVLVEERTELLPWFSGDTPQSSWTGAANASTSRTRTHVLVA